MTYDEIYMSRALQLASAGEGYVSPNPMVGCVIVSADGRIIGEGWHRRYGEAHAEVNAMASVTEDDIKYIDGSTLYVTLEPCSHYGKTPPCADMVAASGVKRIIVAMTDPNPKVSGRGIARLKAAGKEVVTGVLADEAAQLNRRFLKAQVSDRPFVTLKWACDAAGDMGFGGDEPRPSAKYSNPLTRMNVHRLRSCHDAIMVGRRTAEADNPRLDVRYWSGRSPERIILGHNKGESLAELLRDLREKGITSLLVEGGATLLESFISEGLYDEIYVERSAEILPGDLKAPLPCGQMVSVDVIRENIVARYDAKNK